MITTNEKGAIRTECLGPRDHGGWETVEDSLDRNSIVYSFGVGDNISWDLALIEKYGCAIHAFDPTPISLAWISKQTLPRQFKFIPEGISTHDGVQKFYFPFKEGKMDMSAVRENKRFAELPVKRLRTFMKERCHDHIDLLKIDIEGQTIELGPRQGCVIPKGVLHRPRAERRSVVLMVETSAIVPTGDEQVIKRG